MKKIKISIIILIVLISISIIAIIILNKSNDETRNNLIKPQNVGTVSETTETVDVQDESRYFTVVNCINDYLSKININNSVYYGRGENNEQILIVKEEDIKQNIYDLLSKNYIEKNKIDLYNLNNFIEMKEEDSIFVPITIKQKVGENSTKYLATGIIQDLNNNYIDDLNIIVNLDIMNSTYSIEPLENYNNGNIENEDESIEKNDNNSFNIQKITNEYVSTQLLVRFKRLSLCKPEVAYNLIDEEYRNKRFKDLNGFKKFVDDNRDEISRITTDKYLANKYEDSKEYICMDKYENIYVFNVKDMSNMSVKLDTYTIISDKFKETYDSSDEEYKVAMNIDKWVQMLNTRDYKTAYSVLDETFRNNNWGSEETFEQYMRENFPLHYDVEYITYSNEGATYVQQINLTDITGENEGTISLNIIMQLKDNYEFVMSFSVQE